MKRIILCATLSFGLFGCATTSGLGTTVSSSDFDNSKTINIAPHGLSCKKTLPFCPSVGFKWTDSQPDKAYIQLAVYDLSSVNNIGGNYVSIKDLRLKVDGNLVTLKPAGSGLTDYSYDKSAGKTSVQAYHVPISLLSQIHSSKETLVQVVTDKGNLEDYFIKSDADTKSYHALGRFLETLSNQRK